MADFFLFLFFSFLRKIFEVGANCKAFLGQLLSLSLSLLFSLCLFFCLMFLMGLVRMSVIYVMYGILL